MSTNNFYAKHFHHCSAISFCEIHHSPSASSVELSSKIEFEIETKFLFLLFSNYLKVIISSDFEISKVKFSSSKKFPPSNLITNLFKSSLF